MTKNKDIFQNQQKILLIIIYKLKNKDKMLQI